MMKKICSSAWLGMVLLFIYFPILILAVYSFLDTPTIGASGHFSLQNYVTLFTTPELHEMILGTLSLALKCAIISTILGTMGAIGTFYSKKGMKGFVATSNQIPVVNADVVTGFSICVLLIVVFGMDKDTFIPLIIGHVVMASPFVYLSVVPKLKQMDHNLYEAALDLGASATQALIKIVIPQIIPGIIAGFLLAVTLSLDDYFITTYTKPATFDTISTYVVNATRGSHTELKTALWALSTVIFAVILFAVLISNITTDRKAGAKNGRNEM
ncbi:ABC transporter permease [Clostridium aminobutyricum]|uniref:ABC transporter permease n=1 Tax=Clostridium aminobutyricum TaxID=33953 RepID=A0A939D7N4_CLOAM|nr:ABC transporter permease [Clostridium aminobutyricum]MBN7772611.1 ABC transporter permease [Clostridium aminobutyricum]